MSILVISSAMQEILSICDRIYIPGGFFTPDFSDEKFDAYVIPLIEEMLKDGRSVLAVGDQVVPGATFERVKRVNELAEKYGYYK